MGHDPTGADAMPDLAASIHGKYLGAAKHKPCARSTTPSIPIRHLACMLMTTFALLPLPIREKLKVNW